MVMFAQKICALSLKPLFHLGLACVSCDPIIIGQKNQTKQTTNKLPQILFKSLCSRDEVRCVSGGLQNDENSFFFSFSPLFSLILFYPHCVLKCKTTKSDSFVKHNS